MTPDPLVLVIDDEPQIRKLLEVSLTPAGYRVQSAVNGSEGITFAGMHAPEVIILDLGLPDIEGMEVLTRIREWSTVPILVLSARSGEREIIACLDAGADDYLVKPFRPGELVARVKTALRHRPTVLRSPHFTHGTLDVDLDARVVRKNGEEVKLTATEYALLALFVRNAGRVLTHKYILEQVWGPTFAGETQYTRVYVGQIRKKIEDDPSRPALIVTESGIGYRLLDEATP